MSIDLPTLIAAADAMREIRALPAGVPPTADQWMKVVRASRQLDARLAPILAAVPVEVSPA